MNKQQTKNNTAEKNKAEPISKFQPETTKNEDITYIDNTHVDRISGYAITW